MGQSFHWKFFFFTNPTKSNGKNGGSSCGILRHFLAFHQLNGGLCVSSGVLFRAAKSRTSALCIDSSPPRLKNPTSLDSLSCEKRDFQEEEPPYLSCVCVRTRVLNLEKEERAHLPATLRDFFDKVHFASLQPRSLLALNLTRRGKTKVPLQSPPRTSNVCVCV